MQRRHFLGIGAALGGLFALHRGAQSASPARDKQWQLSEDEWRKRLTPEQFSVLREEGTEYPGSSPLLAEKRQGTFNCAGCDLPLYSSETKYESGTGWPSFWAAIEAAVGTHEDNSLFMTRTEVHCARCGGHLGHVFDDGPPPTGKRHCINGVALNFRPAEASAS